MRRTATLLVVLALALVACGGDDGDATDDGRTTTSSSTTTSTSTTTTTAPCTFAGTVEPQENALAPVDQLLTEVTTTTDGCVDTITFTFRPSTAPAPSYRIEYSDGPFVNSAGETIRPAGTAFLRVRFQPAWIADLGMESAPLTYTGPRMITPPGTRWVRGLALYDAFEAVVGWVVGIDGQRPYTVDASPGRAVITIG